MTSDERSVALQSLGYNPRQAEFLALVAVHGGYFLRRHYAAFLGRVDGGTVTDLLHRVVGAGHASRRTVARDTHVYHLSSRSIYAVIGEHESRFRRPALPPTVTTRLMTLDLVLGWRDRTVLATEADKVTYFTETWAIPKSVLPATAYRYVNRNEPAIVHYFVDHAPIALASQSPEVTFAYVQGWTQGTAGFDTFLRQYRTLIERLPVVRVLYVTTRPGLVGLAKKTWSKVFHQAGRARSAPTPEQLSAHFQLRQRFEKAGPWGLSEAERERYMGEKARFLAPEWQPWYARWCAAGDVVLEALRAPVLPARVGPAPQFEGLVLARWYPVFSPLEPRHDTHQIAA